MKHEPLMRMSSHHFHAVLHGKIAIGSSGTVFGRIIQPFDHRLLYVDWESSPRAELWEAELVLIGQFHFLRQFAEYLAHIGYVAEKLVFDFGYDGEQRYFIQCDFIKKIADFNMQPARCVQMDIDLVRIKTERRQPFPIDSRKKPAIACHVFQFLFRKSQPAEFVEFAFERFQKLFGIFSFVSVVETESAHCVRE